MLIKFRYIFFIFSFFVISCQAKSEKKNGSQKHDCNIQVDSIDLEIFNSLTQLIGKLPFDSMPQTSQLIEIGKLFLQTPYVSSTLDQNETEKLVVNLHQLDCTTYLENVLALFLSLNKSETNISSFYNHLETIRYRKGELSDYTSRLHYFSDWIIDNETKGVITNITQQIGGEPYQKTIHFMSSHINSYPALLRDSSLIKKIIEHEKKLNTHEHFYIPENKISNLEELIHSGDFIAITSTIEGLDVSHTGIAIHLNDRLHLMHASSKAKKVVISELPLAEMIQRNRLQSGIIVARVINN